MMSRYLPGILAALTLITAANRLSAQSPAEETGPAPVSQVRDEGCHAPLPEEKNAKTCEGEAKDTLAFEQRQAKRIAQLEADATSFDPTWSRSASWQVTEAVERTLQTPDFTESQGVRLSSVSCGTKICRLEITHTDQDALDRFLAAFPMQLSWGYPVDTAQPTDGTTVLFLQRETSPSAPSKQP